MLAMTNEKNNLDRPLIKKLLILGLLGAAVTGVGNLLLAEGAKTLYPAHGMPFPPEDLRKNRRFLSRVRLRPL